jgi:hypothetical protein
MPLTGPEAVQRFSDNEARFSTFVNEVGVYMDIHGNPVETLQSALARWEQVVNDAILPVWQLKTTSFNATVNSEYDINSLIGGVICTLPANPANNDRIGFNDVTASWNIATFTILGNGHSIAGNEGGTVTTAFLNVPATFYLVFFDGIWTTRSYVRAAAAASAVDMHVVYDPTNVANVVLTADQIEQIVDISSKGHNAIKIHDNFRPDFETGGITAAVTNISVKTTTADGMTISNGKVIGGGKDCIGLDAVLTVGTLTIGSPQISSILYSQKTSVGTTVNRFIALINAEGLLRAGAARLSSDPQISSSAVFCKITQGAKHYIRIECNYMTGRFKFQVDGLTEEVEIFTGGVPGWNSGLGNIETNDSSADPEFFRVSIAGNLGNIRVGNYRVYTGPLTPSLVQAQRANMDAIFGLNFQTVGEDVISPNWRDHVYEAIGGLGSGIEIDVIVTSGPDSVVQGRLVDALTPTTVCPGFDWADRVTTFGGRGTFTFNSVPAGDWVLELRKLGENQGDAYRSTNRITVADRFLMIGQSPMSKAWAADGRTNPFASTTWPVTLTKDQQGPITKHRRNSGFGWFSVSRSHLNSFNNSPTGEPTPIGAASGNRHLQGGVGGNAMAVLQLEYEAITSRLMASICYSIGGSPVRDWIKAGTYPWGVQAVEGPNWTSMIQTIYLSGNTSFKTRGCLYFGGEDEALDGISGTLIKEHYKQVRLQLVQESGYSSFVMWLSLLGPLAQGQGTDDDSTAIRTAQMELCEDFPNEFKLAHNPCDCPHMGDNLHISANDRANKMMPRTARQMARHYFPGSAAFGAAGPRIVSGKCIAGTNLLELTVAHDGGTTLQDKLDSTTGTNLSQFGLIVMNNGIERNITASALLSGKIRLTFDGPTAVLGTEVWARHQNGRQYGGIYGGPLNSTVWSGTGNIVFDNTALKVPLQPTKGWFKSTVTAT